MIEKYELFIHFVNTCITLLKPGGAKAVIAENLALKQQLITLNRGKQRAPKLSTFDRFFFGFMASVIHEKRLEKIAVVIKPATIIRFHKALVKRKYRGLY